MNEDIRYLPPEQLWAFNDHHFYTGQSGSGKSVAAERDIVKRVETGKYIGIDMGDKGRFENFCYLLEETNSQLIRQLSELTMGYEKPRKVKCKPYLICGKGLYYNNKLPKCIKLMAFKKEDLNIDQMMRLLGGTENLYFVLARFKEDFGEDANLQDVSDVFFNRKFKGEPASFKWGNEAVKAMVSSRLKTWLNSGIFTEHSDIEQFDFKKQFNEPGYIISFNNFLLLGPEEETVSTMLIENIFSLKRMRYIKPKVVLYLRELMNFLNYDTCKKQVVEIVTQGRGYNIDVVACFQSPTQIRPKHIRTQPGYYTQLKSHFTEAEKLLDIQFVPRKYLQRVPYFNAGECILATGTRWDKNVLIPPTAHRHADPRRFDVLNALGKEYGWKTYNVKEIFESKIKEEKQKELEENNDGDTSSQKHYQSGKRKKQSLDS